MNVNEDFETLKLKIFFYHFCVSIVTLVLALFSVCFKQVEIMLYIYMQLYRFILADT